MNILLMGNFTNPRFDDVVVFLASRGHTVDQTQDHRLWPKDLTGYDIGVSFYYRVMVKQKDLDQFKYGVINNHPGKLPEVRGAFTNIWPISAGAPCGVTVQLMDAGLDTGPIIAEREVEIFATDTGENLWNRLVDNQYRLFCDTWPRIEQEVPNITTYPQSGVPRTWKMSDVDLNDNLSRMDDGDFYFDLLRARTHSQYPGCFVVRDGRKIGIRVQLEDLGPA
jgi:methionyl-tRNA formyltransferase